MKTESKIELVLAYALSWVGGLIIYFVEKRNSFLRFHSMQSILLGVIATVLTLVISVLSWIPFLGWLFRFFKRVVCAAWLVITIICIIKAWNGDMYRLPVIGDKAEEFSR